MLESLTIHIEQDIELRDDSGLGNMLQFIALKHLSIQTHILLGCGQTYRGDTTFDKTMLAATLPPGLQMFCRGYQHFLVAEPRLNYDPLKHYSCSSDASRLLCVT